MLIEGVIIRDSSVKNLPNKLGGVVANVKQGERLRITDMKSQPDGLWYFINGNGWIKKDDIQITKDLGFLLKAKKLKILDKKAQAFNILGGLVQAGTGSIMNAGMDGCFGDINNRSSNGGMFNPENSIGDTLGAFGVKNPIGGVLGSAIGEQSIGSLSDGSFIGGVVSSLFKSAENAISGLLNSFFSRLNYVLGFNVIGILKSLTGIDLNSLLSNFGNSSTSSYVKDYARKINGGTSAYTEIDRLADLYFYYRGNKGWKKNTFEVEKFDIDGNTYTRTMSWGDFNFTTDEEKLLPKQVEEEVKFHKELYENVYDDIADAVKATKTSLNLNISRSDWFINFNRFKSTTPDYHLTFTHQHIFMTRPNLNIFASNSSTTQSITNSDEGAFFTEALKRHKTIAMSLTKMFSGQHDFIPIIHNASRSLDVQDQSLETTDYGETLTGWKLVYAGNMVKSMTSGSFSISYIDDEKLSISYMHLIWLYYMNGVKRGIFEPLSDYVRNTILDYAVSVYYIVTDPTDENIVFWTKYWGVFPTNYPSSAFSMSSGRPIAIPEISIQYAYSFKKDMDPVCLAEFNKNSQGNGFNYIKPYNENTMHATQSIVGAPFIEYKTASTGASNYKLRFRQA